MNLLKFFIAVLPFAVLIRYFYLRDKREKEPLSLMIRAFASGCLSIFPILFFEFIFELVLKHLNVHDILIIGIVPGIIEEGVKYLIFISVILNNKEFDEPYDGILYAVLISLGFAIVENIIYVIDNSAVVGVLRAFTAVPGHAMFGISMGYFFYKAKFFPENSYSSRRNYILAFLTPALLHFSYNFIIKSSIFIGYYSLIALILYMWFMIELSKKKLKKSEEETIVQSNN